jgi:hypothetical protein
MVMDFYLLYLRYFLNKQNVWWREEDCLFSILVIFILNLFELNKFRRGNIYVSNYFILNLINNWRSSFETKNT